MAKQPDRETQTAFGESNEIDPTPAWIPFVFVIGIAVVFVFAFVMVTVLMR